MAHALEDSPEAAIAIFTSYGATALSCGCLGQDFLTRLPILWLCENCRRVDVFTSLNHKMFKKAAGLVL